MLKLLLIRFSSIGDIVLTSPVIRTAKKQLGAEVHFLTKASFSQLLTPNPHVDKVYVFQKNIKEVLPQLQAEQYDYIIDLHKNLRSWQVRLALRCPSLSFDKLNWEKWLLTNFKINRLPEVHLVDRYLAGVAKLGITNDGGGLDYFIPSESEMNLTEFFQENPLPHWNEGFVAFAIGAAHATKRLPPEQIILLCQKIKKPVVLLGGPGDAETGKKVAATLGSSVLDTCGKLSLHQSASMVRQAALVVSHDTGMMHIAAAFNKPIISIWGNTIPEFGMYPYYPQGIQKNITMEVKGLPCRPCSKIGSATCPKGHFKCMKNLDLDQIAQVVNQD